MVVIVSLFTAVIFGAGDFCGGLASKHSRAIQVVTVSHLVGLVGGIVASVVADATFILGDFALGGLGGVFGGVGVWLLYRRLAQGPMHVVAPLTAVTSAVVPTVWGFAIGERLNSTVIMGLVLALAAISLVSRSTPSHDEAPVTSAIVAESLLAGAGFGAFFIVLDFTDPVSTPWPVVGARVLTGTGLLLFLLLQQRRRPEQRAFPRERSVWGLLILVGLFDTAANIGFLWATTRGALAVVSVLTSLYPISTVVLARYLLGERMNRWQQVGFGGAIAASAIIGAG